MRGIPLVFALLVALGGFAHADMAGNLQGYWRFDENTGGTALDSSGNGNHGTLFGSPAWAAGYTNSDLNFDDAGSHRVHMGTPASLDITGALTLSLWINRWENFGAGDSLVGKLQGTFASGMQYYIGAGAGATIFRFAVSNGTAVLNSDSGVTNNNQWYHIAGVYNGTDTTTLYLNGAQVDSDTSASFGTLNTNSAFRVGGRDDNGGYSSGLIDEVRVYNRALTPYDINQLYHCQPPTIVGQNWQIAYGTLCEFDYNATIGGDLDIKDGNLTITPSNTLTLPSGGKIYLRKAVNNKLLLQRLGRLYFKR